MEYKLDFCSPDCFSMRCAVCPGPNGCTRHSDTTRQANILFFLRPHRTHFSKGTKSFLNVVVVLVYSCWLALDLYICVYVMLVPEGVAEGQLHLQHLVGVEVQG